MCRGSEYINIEHFPSRSTGPAGPEFEQASHESSDGVSADVGDSRAVYYPFEGFMSSRRMILGSS